MVFSIHRASVSEQKQADINSHSTWGKEESVDSYLERCKNSPQRNKAQCWVLTVDGRVVSSLGCLSLQFYSEEGVVDGFGLASVHTRTDMRKKGYAEKLCQHVIEYQKRNNAHIGLLFSDVSPQYYEKMGFSLLSQKSHDCKNVTELIQSGARSVLESINPRSEMDWLHTSYHRVHSRKALALARNEEYWKYSLTANSEHLFWAVVYQDERVGYVRVVKAEELWAIVECVIVAEDRETVLSEVYRQIAFLAQQDQVSWISSWQPPPKKIASYFTQRKRSKAWPMMMVESMPDPMSIPIYNSDYF